MVGSQRGVVKTPVHQVILSSVEVPGWVWKQNLHSYLELWRKLRNCTLLLYTGSFSFFFKELFRWFSGYYYLVIPFQIYISVFCISSLQNNFPQKRAHAPFRCPNFLDLSPLSKQTWDWPFLEREVVGHFLPVPLSFIVPEHGRFSRPWRNITQSDEWETNPMLAST